MPDAVHDSGADLVLGDLHLADANCHPPLDLGQTVVISSGVLQGATGTVVKRSSRDNYLVSLGEQKSQFWAKLPAHLLRAT